MGSNEYGDGREDVTAVRMVSVTVSTHTERSAARRDERMFSETWRENAYVTDWPAGMERQAVHTAASPLLSFTAVTTLLPFRAPM